MNVVCVGPSSYPEIPKTTSARLDYSIDWAGWLPEGDSLASFEFTLAGANPAGTPLEIDAQGRTGAVCTAWLSGGTNGVRTELRCSIVTAANRRETRTLIIRQVISRGA